MMVGYSSETFNPPGPPTNPPLVVVSGPGVAEPPTFTLHHSVEESISSSSLKKEEGPSPLLTPLPPTGPSIDPEAQMWPRMGGVFTGLSQGEPPLGPEKWSHGCGRGVAL